MTTKTIIYCHGFNSSPACLKSRILEEYLQHHHADIKFFAPVLLTEPQNAIERITKLMNEQKPQNVTLIGSSLGGYYATYLAEKKNCKAVLNNPAIKPYNYINTYIGEHINPYTGIQFSVTSAHREQLLALEIPTITRHNNFLVLLQTGDKVIDYRKAQQKFSSVQQIVQPGGSHEFENFHLVLPDVLEFCQ